MDQKLFLYRVTLRGMRSNVTGTAYGWPYVVASNPTEAYDKVYQYLCKRDVGFSKDRELVSIELLAGTGDYPDSGYQLFL